MRGFDTPIGQHFRQNRCQLALACLLAFVAVLLDFWLAAHRYADSPRAILAAAVVGVYLLRAPTARRSLGLRVCPVQRLSYWMKIIATIAALMLVPIIAFLLVAMHWGWEFPRIPPNDVGSAFVRMCVVAPILEELIYRFAICCPATAVVGPTGAIILSGLSFAGVHFIYGNPGPDNFLAGYVLAWVYLKSGSLVLPVVMHSLGNSVALLAQAANWYLR